MGKSSRHVTHSKKRPGAMPARIRTLHSTPARERQKLRRLVNQFNGIFEALPDSVIVCDQEKRIIWINAAALKLFEVPSCARWEGRSYQQFLQGYKLYDEQQRPISMESRLANLVTDNEAGSGLPAEMHMLYLPSGRKVSIDHWCSPLFDAKKHAVGTVSVFHVIPHRYQKALHLQHVHKMVLTLINAISHVPESINLVPSEKNLLLSPPVTFVAQQLVDVIRQVLGSRRVTLIAREPEEGYSYHVAGSGLTAEEEQYWFKTRRRFHPAEFVDETVLTRLSANQEVIVADNCLRRPLPFSSAPDSENLLLIPLFLSQQWVGALLITKAGPARSYTLEEIALVKAVAAQTMLIIEGLSQLCGRVETQARVLIQQEMQRLSHDFLTLASHELFTPLTAIIGNIQLAQRRLEVLKHLAVKQPERVSEKIEHV